MKINSETKISALIKTNSQAIETIISVSPSFTKLRNPLLRGILASRTSISDAARIGKCEIEELFQALVRIGFELEDDSTGKQDMSEEIANPKILKAIKSSKINSLDVRPTLERGGDPFNEIMRELMLLQDGYGLEVINSFEPTPLIKIARDKGFDSLVKTEGDVVFTYFLKVRQANKKEYPEGSIFEISLAEHKEKVANCSKEIHEIDVRDLEMPLPMVTILKELEKLKENGALYVHHKKVPQYLLPELAERNFKTWIAEVDDHNVKLLIHK